MCMFFVQIHCVLLQFNLVLIHCASTTLLLVRYQMNTNQKIHSPLQVCMFVMSRLLTGLNIW